MKCANFCVYLPFSFHCKDECYNLQPNLTRIFCSISPISCLISNWRCDYEVIWTWMRKQVFVCFEPPCSSLQSYLQYLCSTRQSTRLKTMRFAQLYRAATRPSRVTHVVTEVTAACANTAVDSALPVQRVMKWLGCQCPRLGLPADTDYNLGDLRRASSSPNR